MMSKCWVLVLGDFGRSPRMQYHTESLLKKDVDVCVIAFKGSPPLSSIASHPRFDFFEIPSSPSWTTYLPRVIYLAIKAIFQFLYLFMSMVFVLSRPDCILVQLPPAIPTLFVCACVKYIRRTRITLDWHNFAFTLMQLNPQTPSIVVQLAKWIEVNCGRFGDQHFCVSQAMQQKLKEWKIEAKVVYDRPHSRYKRATLEEKHILMKKLETDMRTPMHFHDFCSHACEKLSEHETLFTKELLNGEIQSYPSKPVLLVSSTSWTPDEDFSILLNAVERYDHRKQSLSKIDLPQHPNLLLFITGKGPLKSSYIEKMKQMDLKHVAIRTLWLDPDDYPVLLGCADLGVSLHTSSSGVDLPMKVVDMFGCCLPVCSVYYSTISELVESKKNGLLFSSSQDLCETLWNLFEGFPELKADALLNQMYQNLRNSKEKNWDENWDWTVWPVLMQGL